MEENRGISRGEGSGREGELLSPAAPLYRASPGHRHLPEATSQDLLPLSGSLPLDSQHSAVFAHLLGSSIFITRPRLWGICLCLCHFWNLLYIFLCLFSDSHSSLPWHLPPHTFFLTIQTYSDYSATSGEKFSPVAPRNPRGCTNAEFLVELGMRLS